MSTFVDQLLLQFGDPTHLVQLLAPPNDPDHTRLRGLVEAVYDMPFATLHAIRDVQVRRTEFQRPLFPPGRLTGTWQQTIPSYTRSDISLEQQPFAPLWLDILAMLDLTLVLEVDPGEVESILNREVADFNTLAEFRARFRFIDLDAFMAKHKLTTVDDLKEAYHYLITEIHLRAPGPFNADNPANHYHFPLEVILLMREVIDVTEALRAVKLARTAGERVNIYRPDINTAEVRTPYAPVLIFPEAALNGLPFTAAALQTFFAAEYILSLFVTPL
ncbi:MAG: hypothetical protein H6633_27315 [Anaerolineales bacterium]|nr:hypothetical protein [Anaerolineales bacterium]